MNIKSALVVSANYKKAYPIIKSLKKAGYFIVCGIDENTTIFSNARYSRYIDSHVKISNPETSEKRYINTIIGSIKKHNVDIIIPVGFIDFLLISKYKDILEKYTVVPIDDYEKILSVSNKWLLQSMAERINIKYPRTIHLSDIPYQGELSNIVKSVGFPLVLKGIGDGTKPVFLSLYKELKVLLISGNRREKILQEFIVGASVGYFVLSDKGIPLIEYMHRRVLESTPLGGASIKACSYYDSRLLELGRKIVRYLNWTGVMMVECIRETETGEHYLIEINPKFWGSLELSYTAGVDFSKGLANFFLEGERPVYTPYKNICFSWLTEVSSHYSHYSLRTLFEAFKKSGQKNLVYTDLHLNDPLDASIRITRTIASILEKTNRHKESFNPVYITRTFKSKINEIGHVICDLDKTLVNLKVNWRKVIEEAKRRDLLKENMSVQEAYYKYFEKNTRAFERLSCLTEEIELNAAQKILSNEALTNSVRQIKDLGISFSVVSKQSFKVIKEALRRLGVLVYVDDIIGREKGILRAQQIGLVLERLRDEETPITGVMFGDSLQDVKAALRTGLNPCLVTSTNFGRLQARGLGVSHVDKVEKIMQILIHKKGE